ncbi:MAG: hypothetical protein D6737_15595 [Chloroflexi bacterium]|nr:MAG: hypothetical protein D6737_15595 [Chloroflexota bacterium]
MRTYYSLLRSTNPIQIDTLIESHTAIDSSLHIYAREPWPDASALVYNSLRLPSCITDVDNVIVGQLEKAFIDNGYGDVAQWERAYAPGRRRRVHFDGKNTLAVFIASRSDIDDLVPMLTAYQIEWNKLHAILVRNDELRQFVAENTARTHPMSEDDALFLAEQLGLDIEELRRIETVWLPGFFATLNKMAATEKHFRLQLLAGSLADYRRATHYWWHYVNSQLGEDIDLGDRPVYFVSSNTHSIVNLLTGFARREEKTLMDYVRSQGHEDLLAEYDAARQTDESAGILDNFLYYVLKKYLEDNGHSARQQLQTDEKTLGITRIVSQRGFEIETQIIEISKLRSDWLDPRLCESGDESILAKSDALIINIDYPLGLAAYEVLTRVTESAGKLLGVYVMGKAATLNARIGDLMIPNVVHDEHSQNTYLFDNCFSAADVAPYMTYSNSTVLDNQKAISVPGTFLQNARYMTVFYHEGYTIIEMEAGPYLSSIYEAIRPKRHPQNEIATLYNAPFDIGFLHYASDTPRSKGENLGARSLRYAGMESTYASAVAIVSRILRQEAKRLRENKQTVPLGGI